MLRESNDIKRGEGSGLPSQTLTPAPRTPRRRLAALTDAQIRFLQAALSYWERSIADTSYDPQVEEWARTHRTAATGESAAAIREALATSVPESDW
jgi:hypothetical protein